MFRRRATHSCWLAGSKPSAVIQWKTAGIWPTSESDERVFSGTLLCELTSPLQHTRMCVVKPVKGASIQNGSPSVWTRDGEQPGCIIFSSRCQGMHFQGTILQGAAFWKNDADNAHLVSTIWTVCLCFRNVGSDMCPIHSSTDPTKMHLLPDL